MCRFTNSSSNLYSKAINLQLFENAVDDSLKVYLRPGFPENYKAFWVFLKAI